MTGAGVGAERQEKVGVAGNIDAFVSRRAPFPFFVQLPAIHTGNRKRCAGVADVETGGKNQAVELVLDALNRAHSVFIDPGNGPGDQLAIGLL